MKRETIMERYLAERDCAAYSTTGVLSFFYPKSFLSFNIFVNVKIS